MPVEETEKIWYGFFSQKQADKSGIIWYLNEHGKEVAVTYLTTDPEGKNYLWDDKVCVGVLGKFVRNDEISKYSFK